MSKNLPTVGDVLALLGVPDLSVATDDELIDASGVLFGCMVGVAAACSNPNGIVRTVETQLRPSVRAYRDAAAVGPANDA